MPYKDKINELHTPFLITGATGFVGKSLIEFLSQEKHVKNSEIKVISRNYNSSHETVICDFRTDRIPSSALVGISTIFHLAGVAHDFRDTKGIEKEYIKINVEATISLAKLAVKSGVKQFVFVSSVKAGGSGNHSKCMTENDQFSPDGIYGKTKREAELKLLKIGLESCMKVTIIRSALVYGPNVKGNLKSMLLGIKKGWFPPLPEAGNKKSMIHIDDLVVAILMVAESNRSNGEIYIATDGMLYSSRDIYNSMCNIAGKKIPKWSIPKLLFDTLSLIHPHIKYKISKLFKNECYSSEKLIQLGFKPKKTLNEMNF